MASSEESLLIDPYYDELPSAGQPSLDAEIEELDDKEYDIPPVTTTPTLESILYDSDNDSNEEESGLVSGLYQEVGDSMSVASTSSLDSKGRKRDRRSRKSLKETVHGPVLRHVVLGGISAQIVSAAERVHAGLPTAIAVSSMIAVGTSHGIVLVFDAKQALKWCLGDTTTGEQYGAVSSLAFNDNSTRLLIGFVKGQITMWDITNGKLLRTIVDAHTLGTAVLHIQFTDEPTLAVCADSGGSVYELAFKRVLAVRGCDSRCIFSGSRGEVCAIQVLNILHLKNHPLQDYCIVALATLSRVIVVSIRPSLKVHFTHTLKANPTTLPIIRWQTAVIQVLPNKRVMDPVLSFGRENILFFYQMTVVSKDKIQFVPLQKLEVDYICLNFLWLNSRTMVIIDSSEHLHAIDVKTQEELEVIDLADVKLVYGSSHFKGLATGGNVSKAMALAGERSCYQSVASYLGQLFILGIRSVHAMTLRIWVERLDQLVKQGRYPEALALALSFYSDKAKAVLGLGSNKSSRRLVVLEKMAEILEKFVNYTINMIPKQARAEVLEEYYLDSLPLIIEYTIIIDQTDALLQKYYEKFHNDEIEKAIFLESLEVHILNNSLTRIPPLVIQDFVDHYDNKGLHQVLENCLVHLNVETLDLHQVVKLCRANKLYDGIFYIFTRGMGDYTTPFQELIALLENEMKQTTSLSDDAISLGNKLLVYISCCLAGRAYPFGDICDEHRVMVKTEMFRCLTLLHSRGASDDELPYPYLRIFLEFDTRELLNVLALAFEEPEFKKDAGLFQRQRLVDILLQIMVNGDGYTPSQIGALFTFLARQMAQPDNTVVVNRLLFEQVLEYLTNPNDETRHAERQQALLELLNAGGLQHYDEEKLLQLADQAEFFQVCELLYEQRKQYHKILSCYLKDKLRQVDIFNFIEIKLKDENSEEDTQFIREIIANIKAIIEIDHSKAAVMILKCFPEKIPSLIDSLNNSPEVLYQLLSGLVNAKNYSGIGGLVDIVCHESNIQETYIRLMCQYDAHLVVSYIKSTDCYKLKTVLRTVEEFKINDATAYLLEKLGDVHGAYAIVLENFKTSFQNLEDVQQIESNREHIKNNLNEIVEFCQRNSKLLNESERKELWLPLLETMLNYHKSIVSQVSTEALNTFKDLTCELLNAMIGHVKMSSILQHILQDPLYGADKIGDMKDLFLGMLESYHYEMILLKTTKNLVYDDLHYQMTNRMKIANRGISSHNNLCHICGKNFSHYTNENIILFRCRHSYHEKCLNGALSNNELRKIHEHYCIECNRQKETLQSDEKHVSKNASEPRTTPSRIPEDQHIKNKMTPEQIRAINIMKQKFHSLSKNKNVESSLQLAPPRGQKWSEEY
ncbi:Vacuolar protein sorting-associated protein 8 [Chamberlinius hualienensis]